MQKDVQEKKGMESRGEEHRKERGKKQWTKKRAAPLLGGSWSQSHPSRHDGVDISGVAVGQGHEVGVERPDSLKHQPDVAGRGEVQQGRGGVVRTGPAIDQRGVDLSGDEQTDGGKEEGMRDNRQRRQIR